MASAFPNGAIISLGATYDTPIVVSGISNANPAVATAAGHGLANGDIVLVNSGWPALNASVARVAGQTSGSFNLEGVDTTSTTRYPTGAGAGTVSKVLTWVPISQVTDSATSGGEQQFFQWVYLEDGQQRQRPTFRNARALTLTMDFDANLAWHAALLKASDDGTPHVIRVALPNGSSIYYNMYIGFDGEPTLNINQNMQVTATMSFANPRSQRYAA